MSDEPAPVSEAPAGYRADVFPRPAVTVDLCVFTVTRDPTGTARLELLVVERGEPPFRGDWALPGGFVIVDDRPGAEDQGERVEDAAARELEEETGLAPADVVLAQLGAYGALGRDPRGRVITVLYFALVPPELQRKVKAGTDAKDARFLPIDDVIAAGLAFDHATLVEAVRAHLVRWFFHRPLARALVPQAFTVRELADVYAALTVAARDADATLDLGNFTRRVERMKKRGVVEDAPGHRETGRRRARLYRFTAD